MVAKFEWRSGELDQRVSFIVSNLTRSARSTLRGRGGAKYQGATRTEVAKTNVAKMLDELIARSRQLRQEEITNEIIELGGRKTRGGAGAGKG